MDRFGVTSVKGHTKEDIMLVLYDILWGKNPKQLIIVRCSVREISYSSLIVGSNSYHFVNLRCIVELGLEAVKFLGFFFNIEVEC